FRRGWPHNRLAVPGQLLPYDIHGTGCLDRNREETSLLDARVNPSSRNLPGAATSWEEPLRVTLAYHERTKHHLNRYARSAGYLDWATQPDPFRTYAGAARVELPLL